MLVLPRCAACGVTAPALHRAVRGAPIGPLHLHITPVARVEWIACLLLGLCSCTPHLHSKALW